MIWIRGLSEWTFRTSATGGLGVGPIAGSAGAIYLKDPAKIDFTFHYGGLGAGFSDGFKLPKIGKIKVSVRGQGVSGVLAPAAFLNAGRVFITEAFQGKELKQADFRGATVFVEGGGGLIGGGGASAMLLGINPAAFVSAAPFPALLAMVLESAPAILVTAGFNVGLQAGWGVAAFAGLML